MAVRLIAPLATCARLSPASWRACLTVPGLMSTPSRRPRRPEVAVPDTRSPVTGAGRARSSDTRASLHETASTCPRWINAAYRLPDYFQGGIPSALTLMAIVNTDIAAKMTANTNLRIQLTSFAAQTVPALGIASERDPFRGVNLPPRGPSRRGATPASRRQSPSRLR